MQIDKTTIYIHDLNENRYPALARAGAQQLIKATQMRNPSNRMDKEKLIEFLGDGREVILADRNTAWQGCEDSLELIKKNDPNIIDSFNDSDFSRYFPGVVETRIGGLISSKPYYAYVNHTSLPLKSHQMLNSTRVRNPPSHIILANPNDCAAVLEHADYVKKYNHPFVAQMENDNDNKTGSKLRERLKKMLSLKKKK